MTTDQPTTFSAPLGHLTQGLFEVMSGASNLTLRTVKPAGYRDAEVLAEGRFTGRVPEARVDEGRVRLVFKRGLRDLCFDWRSCSADVALSPLVRWDVLLHGGLNCFDADLSAARLGSLEISGGVSEARIRLPRPSGTVRVFVLGGVNQLGLSRPGDVPLQVMIHGGACGLQVDTLSLGAVGGRFHWETPGFGEAEGRYIVEIHGGVNDARIVADSSDVTSRRGPESTDGAAFTTAAAV